RSRHYGISHHTRTTLERIAIAPVHVPVPQMSALADLAGLDARVQEQARELVRAGHRVHSVAIEGLMEALASSPVPLSTMGRDLRADPGSFLAGAVAGVTAFSFVRGHQRG